MNKSSQLPPSGQVATPERLTPPLKWWGGKQYLAKEIIGMMPRHLHYVEPFFGGGAVLLTRDPSDDSLFWGSKSHERGVSETINDINGHLMNFWRTLQDEQYFGDFKRIVEATPFSETSWQEAETRQTPIAPVDVEAAVAFFVRCRQSRAGGFKDFATHSRNRTRRGMNEQASSWLNCIDGLAAVHSRLKRVVILNQNAIDVIRKQDGPKTLFYLDPPYVQTSRASAGNYAFEMTDDDHRELLRTIKQCKGKVMLSGYHNDLYDREIGDWNRREIEIDNKAAGGNTKRMMTEVVWMNFSEPGPCKDLFS